LEKNRSAGLPVVNHLQAFVQESICTFLDFDEVELSVGIILPIDEIQKKLSQLW